MSYPALVAKVDAFSDSVHARRAADVRCAEGCSACCHAELTVCGTEAEEIVSAVDALSPDARARLAARADEPPTEGGACVMLEADRCVVYPSRPLVCRTQGLPLAYPPGFVPVEAVRSKDARGHDVTWCPLNFEGAPPEPADVLDAGRVDAMLALVDRLRAGEGAGSVVDASSGRVSLRELARRGAALR